ncbi:hypothetical protein PO909_029233 [Leuciscus waleckii]
MAEANIFVAQDQFSCSVCLDLLKDPVTIPCGHSYCMNCITDCWNQEDPKGVYSCPQCRQTFTPRPVIYVECDICTGTKYKAIKSCLVCLNSYCQNHLEQHDNFFKGKKHNLMDATCKLQELICRKHDKLLDIYCRTDQQCICYLCGMDVHKNHDTVTAVEERMEKQEELRKTQTEFKKSIQQKEKRVQELRETVKSHKRSALAAVEDSEKIFTELIRSIERRRSEFTQRIRDQEKAAVSRAEGLLRRLEQEIDDLRRTDAELEQLSHTDNHSNFLQSFQSYSVPPEYTDVPITSSSPIFFDDVAKSVSLLREKLEDFCKQEIEMVLGRVTYIQIISTPDPKTRDEFLQYFCQLTLDPNTVHKRIRLSEANKMATDSGTDQQYPDHPDRFDYPLQVLCRESVCGRCYWELEWSGDGGVGISVSYKSISRKGTSDKCVFGFNRQSWRLFYGLSGCLFYYDKKRIKLSVPTSGCTIGVYVDHSAGTLSFYSVSDTMTLIHRVQTTFTQSLYPGFLLSFGSTVKLHL